MLCMGMSLAEQIATLSPQQQEEVLKGLDQKSLLWDWSFFGRPEQRPPIDNSWSIWLYLAGRGSGKSRAASEYLRHLAKTPGHRFLLVGRTAQDIRDVIVQGDSGILAVSPEDERPTYKPSSASLVWPNGNTAVLRSADEPDGIRGIQATASFCDELAAWRVPRSKGELSAWDQVRIATRLGANPQIIATTTPKRVRSVLDLVEEAKTNKRILVTRGSTYDNKANLASTYLEQLTGLYEGTDLAKQELYGDLLEAVRGALWNDEVLYKAHQDNDFPSNAPIRVLAVDPSVASAPGDYAGIVVVASTAEYDLYKRKAWVLSDVSLKASPEVWAKKAVDTARRWGCQAIITETNQGAALVTDMLKSLAPEIPVFGVHAKVGKKLRAEPIAHIYQQGRIKHVDDFIDLEEQMVMWDPEDPNQPSPDRIDALVHGLTALLVAPPTGLNGGKVRAKSLGSRRINTNVPVSLFPSGGFRVL